MKVLLISAALFVSACSGVQHVRTAWQAHISIGPPCKLTVYDDKGNPIGEYTHPTKSCVETDLRVGR